MNKVESPVSEWPHTTILKEGGVRITGRYGTVEPLKKAWLKAPLTWLFWSVLLFGLASYGLGMIMLETFGVCAILALFPTVWTLKSMAEMQKGNIDVKIFPESIELHGKSYERDMRRIEFRVEQHSLAVKEEADEIRTQKRGSRRYRDALEVVMQYGEKRVPIASMKILDKDQAVALMFRLQDWCERIDEYLQHIKQAGAVPARPAAAGSFKPAADLR